MTLKDRAEKMIDTLAFNRKWDRKTRIRYYVAELEEVAEEAIKALKPEINKGLRFERAHAYEDAAKIAEQLYDPYPRKPHSFIAERIRARAAERGRQCDQYHCGHDSCNAARVEEGK